MKRTKLRIASVAAGAALLIGGLTSTPASAERRTVVVTLADGRQLPVTVDATPGVPVDASQLPAFASPVVSISEPPVAAAPVTTATTTPPAATVPPTTPATTPATNPATPTNPATTTNPPATFGTTSTTTVPPLTPTTPATGTTGTSTTPGTTTGTGTTGTTPTTRTGTTRQPAAVGGVVNTKPQVKGEGSSGAVPRTAAGTDASGELTDANRDGTAEPDETPQTPVQTEGAQPTPDTPGFTVAPTLEQSPAGVPNFFIEQFRIPPFLLPIYQAAAMQYGVPWQILAAINEIETDYGRNLSVSTAGALGWMQFMPATWETYGEDANGDGVKDPYNPVDAIFAAGRYLKAAGADTDLEKAIFAYNHADWYVQSVLLRARVIGGMPSDLVGSLTGLTQGRFPVAARATYADSIDVRRAGRRVESGNAAVTVEGDAERRSINIYAARDAPVVAVNDGTVVKLGENDRLGRFVVLQDVYGNRYTYSDLGSIAAKHPVPKPTESDAAADATAHDELEQTAQDAQPTAPASDGAAAGTDTAAGADTSDDATAASGAIAGTTATPADTGAADAAASATRAAAGRAPAARAPASRAATDRATTARAAADAAAQAETQAPSLAKERLFANPTRPAAYAAGGERQIEQQGERLTTFDGYFSGPLEADPDDYVLKPLREGSTVIAGTILGRIGKTDDRLAPHVEFAIRPAGRGAPRIDPKPILDGWKLLESTAIYKAGNDSVFGSEGEGGPSIGQILLMSKQELQARVLANPNIEVYAGGREDIKTGQIDRRVLATMEFLAASGLKPTITSLKGNHGLMTASGNVSEHSTGNAVDIGAINGIVITPATQGEGSITDITIRRLLTLQGTMKPHQIISLMTYPDTDNTLALPDHDDHIHVGFHTVEQPGTPSLQTLMKPEQWTKLVEQLGTIQNPIVPTTPSRYATKDRDGE